MRGRGNSCQSFLWASASVRRAVSRAAIGRTVLHGRPLGIGWAHPSTEEASSWRGKGRRRLAGPARGRARIGRVRSRGRGRYPRSGGGGCGAGVRRPTGLRTPAGRGEMEVTGLSAPTVTVFISSSLNSFRSEKRYSRSLTIAEFKCKLELVVGSPASCMELELYGADDKFYSKLDQEDALLGSYPVDDGCRIHVIDHSGARLGEYEDVSKVEKYQISQEAYDQRQDSVRSFLKRSKLGRYNEEERAQQEAEATQRLNEEKTQASAIPVGSRCEVRAPGQPPRRGTVMYVGLTDFKPGYWIGVRYDEPLGKNDGSVNGKRYFECQAKYGAFVKPSVVTVGDFPEEDYGLDEM